MTKRLAIIGAILSAAVFVTTLARPASNSEWPPLVAAAAAAAAAFFSVWLVIPVMAYLAFLVLAPVREALRRTPGTTPSASPEASNEKRRSSGDIPAL